jgi:phytoene synthase
VSTPVTEVERAYAHCRELAKASGSSFYAGMRLLAPDRRDAMFAVYALARRIDDVADGGLAPGEKLAHLGEIRRSLDGPAESGDLVLVALADAAARLPIPLNAFDDLIEGAEADIHGKEYVTFADLEHYCRCVAGSIGRLSLGVFDTSDRARAEPIADDLGVALQIGNILRDVSEDVPAGRRYLPLEDLQRFGCSWGAAASGSAASIEGPADLLVAFEAQRGLEWLRRGLELVPLLDRRSAACVLALTGSYRRLLERIASEPGLALQRRLRLGKLEKGFLLARSLIGGAA